MDPALSYEFFPPRTEAQSRRFWRTWGLLESLAPEWVSMTYGALASAPQASLDAVALLRRETDLPVAAHLTCSGETAGAMAARLDWLREQGVNRIVALRGDRVAEHVEGSERLRYASDLVTLAAGREEFDISVAAYPEMHPEASSAAADLDALRLKFERGASRALTQFFFEPSVFLRWRDSLAAAGIHKPVIPGILPIHDIDKVIEFSARCGASVPAGLVEQFRRARDAQARRALAVDQCVSLCQQLAKEGVEEFHLYTLNQSDLVYPVSCELLGGRVGKVAA